MKLSAGDVDVTAGTGFGEAGARVVPLVPMTVQASRGAPAVVWLRPLEARAIGLDLIGAAHAAIADASVRLIAKEHGLDGDSLIERQRAITTDELGPG